MFTRILTGIDATPDSVAVLAHAIRLARHQKATLLAVSVLMHVPDTLGLGPGFGDPVRIAQTLKDRAQVALARAQDLFILAGVDGHTLIVEAGDRDVASVLLEEGHRWRADLMVLGNHPRHGIERALLGSTTESCLRAADIPILVVPPDHPASG
ncbi:universal stress protein [Paraburkholderia tagetis]|uniref:Universal stress protein n=1 Tax=Paraburkholderia tagetis TaxID=2913261 RepID=A0A9X1RXQ6_9BURK|nr:universal stress protein [Paraburkholderia tagetis]MCG5076698.1 universal stress protein [Paraburkholderia tagetis]